MPSVAAGKWHVISGHENRRFGSFGEVRQDLKIVDDTVEKVRFWMVQWMIQWILRQ